MVGYRTTVENCTYYFHLYKFSKEIKEIAPQVVYHHLDDVSQTRPQKNIMFISTRPVCNFHTATAAAAGSLSQGLSRRCPKGSGCYNHG